MIISSTVKCSNILSAKHPYTVFERCCDAATDAFIFKLFTLPQETRHKAPQILQYDKFSLLLLTWCRETVFRMGSMRPLSLDKT